MKSEKPFAVPANKAEIIKEIVGLQQRATKMIGRFAPESWMNLSLTIAQLKSLFFISNEGRTNFKRLAEALGVTPPSVTGIVDKLVEQGLLSRQENPDDRRVLWLETTPKAEALINELRASKASLFSAILAHMDDKELAGLVDSLGALVRAGEAYREEHR